LFLNKSVTKDLRDMIFLYELEIIFKFTELRNQRSCTVI